ncbi:MAG: hypothetical protein KOO63_07890 [Bacteroidales bacterium]|nr:hypothetical protein [Candidatus Latescibacterota bacterium]
MNRRAPKGGYNFPNKRQYRRDVWNGFRTFISSEIKNTHALLMPSEEGTEIGVALKSGVWRKNLHAVDKDPSFMQSYREKYGPSVHTYGMDVVKACEEIAKQGYKLGVANLDLCSPYGTKSIRVLSEVATLPCWEDKAVIAVTALRGRERIKHTQIYQHSLKYLIRKKGIETIRARLVRGQRYYKKLDAARVYHIINTFCGNTWTSSSGGDTLSALKRCGIYINPKNVTLLWMIFAVEKR